MLNIFTYVVSEAQSDDKESIRARYQRNQTETGEIIADADQPVCTHRLICVFNDRSMDCI